MVAVPRRVDDYRGLTQRSRVLLLHAVQRAPGRLIHDLAVETGLPVNTARDHLRILEQEGLVASAPVETGRRGRPPMGWSPVRQSEHSPVAERRLRDARARGEILRGLEPDLDHSHTLGVEAVHQLDALYDHLEDAGMEPHIDEHDLTVGLRPCIYEALMDSDEPEVCSVHARLVQAQLEQAGGPLALRRLHPFVGRERCLLVLGRRGEAARVTRPAGVDPSAQDSELGAEAVQAYRAQLARTGEDGVS